MREHKRRLERLRRLVVDDAQQDVFAPIPVRYYELNEDGERVFVEPGEGELALEEKIRRLVHGERSPVLVH